MIAKNHHSSDSVLVSTSVKPNPSAKGIRIPNVIQIYEIPPAGPLISVGAVSAMYFGQKTE